MCTARDGDACVEVKRAHSAWVYAGLGGWATTREGAGLGLEAQPGAADYDKANWTGARRSRRGLRATFGLPAAKVAKPILSDPLPLFPTPPPWGTVA